MLPSVARRLRLHAGSGWIAAYSMAILPINLEIEAFGGWEQPYAALALLILLMLFCRLSDEAWGSRRTIIFLGLVIGTVALLSPQIVPAAMLMVLVEFSTRPGLRQRIAAGGIMIAVAAGTVITPWVVRNWYALGGFVPVRSNFGLELQMGNNPFANGTTVGTTLEDRQNLFYRYHPFSNWRERDRLVEMGELAYMRDNQRQALQWIREHPTRTAWLTGRRFSLYWFPAPSLWGTYSRAAVFKSLTVCSLTISAMVCLCWLWYTGHVRTWLIVAAMFGPSTPYMITHVDIRYRYPIVALSAVLAAHLLLVVCRALTQPTTSAEAATVDRRFGRTLLLKAVARTRERCASVVRGRMPHHSASKALHLYSD